jgi:hypothetical protein
LRHLLPLTLFVAVACTGSQKGATGPDEYEAWLNEGREAEPQSVEWLYALKDYQGDRQGECVNLHQVLQRDRGCHGEVCGHAAKLGRDWLRLCKEYADSSVYASAERLVADFEKQAAQPPTDCSKRAEAWIADGCGEEGACLGDVGDWATRCAAQIASPLTLTMLEQRIETSYATPRRVALDTRDCDVLADELRKATKCRHKSTCKVELPKLYAYQTKCVTAGTAMPVDLALAALKLMVRTEKGTEIEVAEKPERFSPKQEPLALADGSGVVLQICKERPISLENYVLAARGCDDQVLVARFDEGAPKRKLRAAWVPHPSTATFAKWYPSLAVAGVADLRERDLLEEFANELAGTAQLAENHPTAPEPLGKLLAALDRLPLELLQSDPVAKALSAQDEKFVDAFAELGKRKVAAPRPTEPAPLHAFVRRTENLPLADLKPTGEVEIGATTAGGALRLRRAMPQAFNAYFTEVQQLPATIRFRNLSAEQIEAQEDAVAEAAGECKRIRMEREHAEKNLLRCAFARIRCPQKETTEWTGSLIDAESREKSAWVSTEVAVWSLPDRRRNAAQTAAGKVCPAP